MSTQVLPEIHAATRTRVLKPYLITAGCVAACWLLYHLFLPTPRLPLDDPYIVLHSAQVLHWRYDPNYPGVPPLFGITSAPFLALVYLLLFVFNPLKSLELACWLAILAYVLGLVHMVRVLKLSRTAGTAVVALGLVSSFIPLNLLNGLETCWAMAGIVWTLSLATAGKFRLASLAAGLTAAIRPDLLTFTVPVFAALIYMQPVRERWSFIRRAVPLLVFPILLCMLWYIVQTGHFLPLTGLAKHYYVADANLPLYQKSILEIALLTMCLISCGPLVLGITRIYRNPLALATLACLFLLLLSIYVQFPEGLFFNGFRYPVVIVPMLVWAAAVDARQRRSKFLLFGCLAYACIVTLPYAARTYSGDCRYFDSSLRATADWCNHNLPPDARIAVQDAGYIAYATHFRIIDFVGLKTPQAIAFNRQYTWPTAGRDRAKAVSALASEEQADYLITLTDRSDIKKLALELTGLGWHVDLLKTFRPYAIYRIQRQGAVR